MSEENTKTSTQIPLSAYDKFRFAESGTPLSEVFPNGIYVEMRGDEITHISEDCPANTTYQPRQFQLYCSCGFTLEPNVAAKNECPDCGTALRMRHPE